MASSLCHYACIDGDRFPSSLAYPPAHVAPIRGAPHLLRYLNLLTGEQTLAVVTRYFPEEQLPPKSRLALEELLARR